MLQRPLLVVRPFEVDHRGWQFAISGHKQTLKNNPVTNTDIVNHIQQSNKCCVRKNTVYCVHN